MSFSPKPFYTRNSLAEECGIGPKHLDRHIKAGTARLNKATEKIPGLGIRINGQLALKFIEMMRAKHSPKIQSKTPPAIPKAIHTDCQIFGLL